MNVSLTPELEQLVDDQVKTGRYRSASEVVRDALRLFARREERHRQKLDALRAAVQEGFEAMDRGDTAPGEETMRAMIARREGSPP
ncbi:MAG TPA: type II toxin-antitoxin system ParD family antitoxin [Longimicrobium sp.]|nr:type II toxin-antitoxin system ParD family antitoxin [Longimicrobium sp.]